MGWSVGAAIGAALAGAERVVCLLGDGSFFVRSSGLAVARSLGVPVLFVVAENGEFGTTRTRHPTGSSDPALLPEFDARAVAEAWGIPAVRVDERVSFEVQLRTQINTVGPRLIVAKVSRGDATMQGRLTGVPWLDRGR
jgi:benzoylformate decarboxylase